MKLKLFPIQQNIGFSSHKNTTNQFLPQTMTINQFKQEAILLSDNLIDQDSRILYLLQASNFEEFKQLKIDRNFFNFIKNSSHLLNFFDILAEEQINIEKLYGFEGYSTFSKDLDVLKQLLENYKNILKKEGKIDKILAMDSLSLNAYHIKSFKSIDLYLEDYLTNFDFEFFKKVAKITELKIYLTYNEFNFAIIKKFKNFNLERGYRYILNLSTNQIISKDSLPTRVGAKIQINSFENRMLQITNIKRKIYEYKNMGILPKDIVIIAPDKKILNSLFEFDYEKNLKFVDGISFKRTDIYQKLSAIESFLDEDCEQNRLRIKRLNLVLSTIEDFIEKNYFAQIIDFLTFFSSPNEKEIIEDELLKFRTILNISDDFRELFHIFMNRLAVRRLPDLRGGKILVMDISQTKKIDFQAVIIIDFNEEIVPNKIAKELFLSTNLRKFLQIPTVSERENLEKYHYCNLIFKAKFINISYTKNDKMNESKFLEELNLTKTSHLDGEKLLSILYKKNSAKSHLLKENLEFEFDFTKESISATKLKLFLDCKRRFYLKYIEKLKNFEIPKEQILDNREIGIKLHKGLKILYQNRNHYFNADELFNDLKTIFANLSRDNIFLKYQLDIMMKNFKTFSQNEVKRFMEGYKVLWVEKKFTKYYNGFRLEGFIDRVDVRNNNLTIIDYKSGNIPKFNPKKADDHSDFQLEIYYHLLENQAKIDDINYYDLKNQKLIEWQNADEKLLLFDGKLNLLRERKIDFSMTQNHKNCLYCEYKIICDRD